MEKCWMSLQGISQEQRVELFYKLGELFAMSDLNIRCPLFTRASNKYWVFSKLRTGWCMLYGESAAATTTGSCGQEIVIPEVL